MALLTALALAGCSTVHPQQAVVAPEADAGPRIVIFVVRRGWHTDIGFNAGDIPAPLAAVRSQLPHAHYLLFGFGDEHYLVNHGPSLGGLAGAIWPGPGLVLVTGLTGTPEQAFGDEGVIRLLLSADQARRLEEFVLKTLASTNDVPKVRAAGPYDESYYYFSTLRYSGLHTCNTWTAEALKAAGLAVHSVGVEFAGQVWRQVRQIAQQQNPGKRFAATPRIATQAIYSVAGRLGTILTHYSGARLGRNDDSRLCGGRRIAAADTARQQADHTQGNN
jgi:Protein of unknown function (DUF2459)